MTFDDFIFCCESGGFIDYNGEGIYAFGTEATDVTVSPSQITDGEIDQRFTHVVWFNK